MDWRDKVFTAKRQEDQRALLYLQLEGWEDKLKFAKPAGLPNTVVRGVKYLLDVVMPKLRQLEVYPQPNQPHQPQKGARVNSLECNNFELQKHFSEGGSKECSIDITPFYEGCKASPKKFVDATFVVLFGGGWTELDLDIASFYSVVRFREYLGFSSFSQTFNCGSSRTLPFAASPLNKVPNTICPFLFPFAWAKKRV